MENEQLRRVTGLAVRPHPWQDCFPVVVDSDGKVDMKNDANRAIRKIFNQLGQLDRIKWHQACCQSRVSPAHDAVVRKIQDRLTATLGEQEQPT